MSAIGYYPHRKTCDATGDRRRFIAYAKWRALDYEIASHDKEYEVVYLTTDASISDWLHYKERFPKAKIVYAILDTYVTRRVHLSNFARGVVRYLNGKERKLHWNYNEAFKRMATVA